MWAHFWALCSVALICVSVFVSVPYCFADYSFIVYSFKPGIVILQLFLLKMVLALRGLLYFLVKLRITCTVKNAIGILMEEIFLWINN